MFSCLFLTFSSCFTNTFIMTSPWISSNFLVWRLDVRQTSSYRISSDSIRVISDWKSIICKCTPNFPFKSIFRVFLAHIKFLSWCRIENLRKPKLQSISQQFPAAWFYIFRNLLNWGSRTIINSKLSVLCRWSHQILDNLQAMCYKIDTQHVGLTLIAPGIVINLVFPWMEMKHSIDCYIIDDWGQFQERST